MLGYGCIQTNRRKVVESGVVLGGAKYSCKEKEDRPGKDLENTDVLSHDAAHVSA